MKYISFFLLSYTCFSAYAADMPRNVFHTSLKIPFFADIRALSSNTPTRMITVPITPTLTPLDVQEILRNTIGHGHLMFENLKTGFFDKMDARHERHQNVTDIIEKNFETQEELEELLCFIPLKSDHKTAKSNTVHTHKKATPGV